jgi:hypothetical protein
MSRIFSPGKLMLTSEYVAVDGALVLAIPTKLGQELFYTENEDQKSLIFGKPIIRINYGLKLSLIIKIGKSLKPMIPKLLNSFLKHSKMFRIFLKSN